MISIYEALDYEIRSSWWASWCPIGHELVARYMAWKVKRKHRRYIASLEMTARVKERNIKPQGERP